MTEELKQKAERWVAKHVGQSVKIIRKIALRYYKNLETAYIAGATENGIQWHDLRENPNDLPKDTYDVLDQAGYKVHYNFFQNVWVNEKDEIDNQVIAWCEIPQF